MLITGLIYWFFKRESRREDGILLVMGKMKLFFRNTISGKWDRIENGSEDMVYVKM